MSAALRKSKEQKFTYQDYLTWPDEERWEIIDGIAYNMCPAPETFHQMISMNLSIFLGNKLEGKKSTAFHAPTDVVLSEYNVVQPDVFVVCDPSKLSTKNIQGAPDLVIEILSPSTSAKDRREKKDIYGRYGVKEYILIYPELLNAERYILAENGNYGNNEIFDTQEELPLFSLPGISLPLWIIFGVEKIGENQTPGPGGNES